MVWLLPLSYTCHLFEEYYGGMGFSQWFSETFSVQLSDIDFLTINSVAMSVVIILSAIHFFDRKIYFVFCTISCVFFLNAIIHLFSCLFTMTYSPGVITGLLFYVPIGIIVYKQVFPQVKPQNRKLVFIAAALIHVVVAVIAFTI